MSSQTVSPQQSGSESDSKTASKHSPNKAHASDDNHDIIVGVRELSVAATANGTATAAGTAAGTANAMPLDSSASQPDSDSGSGAYSGPALTPEQILTGYRRFHYCRLGGINEKERQQHVKEMKDSFRAEFCDDGKNYTPYLHRTMMITTAKRIAAAMCIFDFWDFTAKKFYALLDSNELWKTIGLQE
jgi:hypothetical protein